jgi:hypothetical protein
MVRLFAFVTVSMLVTGAPAHGATLNGVEFDLKWRTGRAAPATAAQADLRAIPDEAAWAPTSTDGPRHDFLALATSNATSIAVAVTGVPQARVDLELEALAGHRSFDAISAQHPNLGWNLSGTGNVLGVGTTGTFGIRLARDWRVNSFISLDYNHIDTARFVNPASPHPYSGNNADTGFTGSLGAAVSHRLGAGRRIRALAYGALVAATSNGIEPQEFGSVGARLAHAIGDTGLKAMWEEFGLGFDYRVAPHVRLNGAVLQTLDRRDGEAMAAKIGLQIVL